MADMGHVDLAPAPTPAPVMGEMALNRLFARATGGRDVCGYIAGVETYPLFCYPGATCGVNSQHSVRGCCTVPLGECTLATTCIELPKLDKDCDVRCSLDPLTRKCINPDFPLCLTWSWSLSGGISHSEMMCTDSLGMVFNNKKFSVLTSTIAGLITSISGLGVEGAGLTQLPSESSGTATTAAATSQSPSLPTASFGNSGTTTNNDASNNGVSVGGTGTGLSQGATIAIAVCVTVVGLAILAAIFGILWWRRKKHNRANALAAAQSVGTGGGYTSYDPRGSTAAGTGSQGPYSPAQYPAMAAVNSPHGGYMSPQSPQGQQGWHSPHDVHSPHNPYGVFDPTKADPPSNWSAVDDDRLARMRRFSNDGTAVTNDQTVAGRTDDGFRPQGA